MNWIIYAFYVVCVGFIRVYKWIELQILKLFRPFIVTYANRILGKTGIVIHFLSDPEWTTSDTNRVLSKCSPKYDKLIHVSTKDANFFARAMNTGNLGLGDAYLDNMWGICGGNEEDLTQLVARAFDNKILDLYYNWWNSALEWVELYAFNLQTRQRAFQVGVVHYDLGNRLFERMLDPWMQYTCAYWNDAQDLNSAQVNKMELIAKKLDLKPGMRVLDIGCGWGTLCKYLAEKYKVGCVGVTIGEEGAKYGRNLCKGLPVDIRVQDYRELNEQFDRIVSVGMFEHVGYYNYREYFTVASRCLKDDGIFLLHTIGRNHNYKCPGRSEPFTHQHIFPNGNLPSPCEVTKAIEKKFVIEDWHNFGQDYAKTLYCWRENFLKAWPELQDDFDERFYRMWIFYLSICRAAFMTRRLQLWQIVLTKHGLRRDYRAVR